MWDSLAEVETGLDKPSMVYQKPEYTGRKLEKLELPDVIAFFDDINKFQAATNTDAGVGRHFSESAKNRLIAKSAGVLTQANFYRADSALIFKELQKALRPESILSFTEALKRNTSFPLP
jgi:hypothetical protein